MRSLTFLENITLARRYLLEYNDIKKFQFRSENYIADFQLKKIKEIVALAYTHTDFYHKKYSSLDIHPEDIKTWDDFKKLPTVTKDEILQYRDKCIVDSVKGRADLIISRSSGSSGKVLDIILDARFFISKALASHRFYDSVIDFHKEDKQVLIYTSEYPYRSIFGSYKAKYILNLETPEHILEFIRKEKPALIAGYPSVLIELINKYGDTLKDFKPKAICTHSEHSTRAEREYIGKAFGCNVYDEYSTEELSKCAYECKNFTYHVQEDSVYLEILEENSEKEVAAGEIGEIVGTSLHNYVMPFIRYRQGDLGSIERSHCACGRGFRNLKNIAGRKNDSFKLKNGEKIPSGVILDWTYKLLLTFNIPIQQFQVIQKDVEYVEVIIVPGNSYKENKFDALIVESFNKLFGKEFTVNIKKVESIPKTPVGKHNAIKSLV